MLWLSERFLIAVLDLSEDYIKNIRRRYRRTVSAHRRSQRIMPDTGYAWRWAKIGGEFYYDYGRIPDVEPTMYKSQLPAKEDIIKTYKKAMAESRQDGIDNRVKEALREGYKEYLHCYKEHSGYHAEKLSKACAVLQAAVEMFADAGAPARKNRFFTDLAAVLKRYEVPYLPNNYRRLKEKVLAAHEGEAVAEVVSLPRLGNSNASQYDDPELMSWVFQLRSMPHNFTNAYIARKVALMCGLAGKRAPSDSWFSNLLARQHTKFLTAEGRWGSKGRKGVLYKGYVPQENALFAGDCWMADGTRVNFAPHLGPDGELQHLFVIVIMDVHSGDIIGIHFDTKEDRWAYVNALKMAVNTKGYLPYELVIDRFPGHNTEEWQTVQKRMEYEGCKVTVTSNATGKSKLERLFDTIQTVFMQDSDYYYGQGILSRRDFAHRASEYIYELGKRIRKEGWNFDCAWKEAMQLIQKYRHTPLSEYSREHRNIDKTPAQLHDDSEKPNVSRVQPWRYVEIFGLEKEVAVSRQGIIKTEIQRMRYAYEVKDYDVISRQKKVVLCYDMENLETVHLFAAGQDEANREYLGEAVELRAAKRYGPDAKGDEQLKYLEERNNRIEKRRRQELAEITGAGEDVAILLSYTKGKVEVAQAEVTLMEQGKAEWQDRNAPRILNIEPKRIEDDEDDEINIDIRSRY